ncbi:MAG: NAD-dependent epimerase/dehydratase family protein [Bacteroidetes bacterium]|nr:NAD-dependent epimerase/dehydratase family protein [Bacteroidota bacterium]MCY4205345.1 NAD-dependent epimerase/dehydratase family protein [Bacteroidota bacterium]
MKILVTGGAGFIGSHVTDLLTNQGYSVEVLDDLSSGLRENVPQSVKLHVTDIQSPVAASLMKKNRYQVLVHHAAQMDVRRSVEDPAFDVRVNILGLINLMEAGRENGLRKVIFASTGGAIYGEPEAGPQPESHIQQPVSPYGISKLTCEKLLHFYSHEYGIPYVALRYGNVYGPRQNSHGEAGVIAIFTERLLSGQPTTIHGDGRQTRDYVFVDDVARANFAALNFHQESTAFNIGTGIETDVVTLHHRLQQATGVKKSAAHGPQKSGEQRRSVLDCTKAAEYLAWKPKVSLDEGLRWTAEWFIARKNSS